ncbi:MAG: two-component system chemotaxis response regulator CheV [Polaribacter sp.]|jgi:two-component system chemotaxis response regulator CheV
MSTLMKSIDERTKLAGTNKMEILVFSLGREKGTEHEEVYGINVFKVREVMHKPKITKAPDMPVAVEGMVSLRGVTIPVINLAKYCKVDIAGDEPPSIMIITEYNKNIQGFLVQSVDNIERLNWEDVKAPPHLMDSQKGGLVTAVTEVASKGLVMIMDVEKILAETGGFYDDDAVFQGMPTINDKNVLVVYADDSGVARKQVKQTIDKLGISGISCINGQNAWEQLNHMAEQAESEGKKANEVISIIITDVEMPEMDGYVLTKNIKTDERFNGIPVIMHSSLSSENNTEMGKKVGADAYVAKFEPLELASTIIKLIG